jgi:N-acetylmuramic acid 6-phosphate etherase
MNLEKLTTEAIHSESSNLDEMSSLEIVELMNREDAKIAAAVGDVKESIAAAVDCITERFRRGGRLIYMGAGTSGRLGVLDASECPPTFSTPPEMVRGLIAGGYQALTTAIEGAEDNSEAGANDLRELKLVDRDVVMGIATSGRTPYVIGGLRYARSLGCATIGFACNGDSEVGREAHIAIEVIVGPEILSGSTRLKSGTATKMVLNMLTTGAMIQLGKTYGNMMVDLRATNSKLRARACRLVKLICEVDDARASDALQMAQGETKTAIVMLRCGVDAESARKRLEAASGRLKRALTADRP